MLQSMQHVLLLYRANGYTFVGRSAPYHMHVFGLLLLHDVPLVEHLDCKLSPTGRIHSLHNRRVRPLTELLAKHKVVHRPLALRLGLNDIVGHMFTAVMPFLPLHAACLACWVCR